jgi:hypothetical protein
MERLGIHSLQQALEGKADRDLEEGLNRHLRRLEAAGDVLQDPLSGMPQATAPEPRKPEPPGPLSDLFLALTESVAETYLQNQRPDSAMKIVWEAFVTRPGIAEYRALRDWALKAGSWPVWRQSAWTHLRSAEDPPGDAVGILLWEGHLEEAWNEARVRGATDAQWLELARRREQDFPEESIQIYRSRIEQVLPKADATGYREAVKWLRRVESLLAQDGREREFAEFLRPLRDRHRRRPRLLQLLDEAFGPDPGPPSSPRSRS